MAVHPTISTVTARIIERSRAVPRAYLARLEAARRQGVQRGALSCTNLAHGFAAFPANDKLMLQASKEAIGGHRLRLQRHAVGAPALRALPAHHQGRGARGRRAWRNSRAACRRCATASRKGQPGMELSLFSRDTIAMATAVALSHNMFDAALYLGVCDKIVPGLLIGALHFGHLPAVFVPAGPMTSRPVESRKKPRSASCTRKARSAREELLEARSAVLPRRRHLHLLRHRQQQPDADGGDGPAPAGRRLHHAEHAAARRADGRGRAARGRRSPRRATSYTPVGHVVDEKSHRQRHGRAAGDRRLDQPHAAPGGDRARRPAS